MEKELIAILKSGQYYILLWWLIFFWAIVHATAALKLSRDAWTKMDRIDFLILFIIAIFSWIVSANLAMLITENQQLISLMTSTGSFLWLAWLNKISNAMLDFLIFKFRKNEWNDSKD